MNHRRVVVTGLGVVSALGLTTRDFISELRAGRPGIGEISIIDATELRFKKAAEVRGFDPESYFGKQELSLLHRFSHFAVVAAREAIADSGIEWQDDNLRERTAVVTGTGAGGLTGLDKHYTDLFRHGTRRSPPMLVPKVMSNAAASFIATENGLYGPNFTLSTACSSSNHAIGHAFHCVRSGTADIAVTGGSEAPMSYSNLKAWEALRVVSRDTCRPFTKNRSGMILGEGGAMLVLESEDSATARGAHIYAEIKGFGMSADAHHITQPSVDGAVRAIRAALGDGGVDPESVGYINAHGTATTANDLMEARAINEVFGDHARSIAVSSTKSMHGHTLGAAGAIEAVATVSAVADGVLPPTANFDEKDPDCDIDVIANEARETQVSSAVSNTFAFGGLNAVLVFAKWDG